MDWGMTIGSVYFNSLDIIVFCLAIVGGIADTITGFADSFSHRAGFIVGFFLSLMFTKMLAEVLLAAFSLSMFLSSLISFVLLFLAGYILMRVIGNLLDTALNVTGLRAINSLLGFIWGVVEVLVFSAFILYVLELQTAFDLSSVLDRSQFVLRLVRPLVPETVNWFTLTVNAAHV
ncbi:MAG: CvpA family protein [Sphaerochaeta sp.]|nr:CvpA family protein [Spirochaetales bacterium]